MKQKSQSSEACPCVIGPIPYAANPLFMPSPAFPQQQQQQQFSGYVPVTKYIPYEEFMEKQRKQKSQGTTAKLKQMLTKKNSDKEESEEQGANNITSKLFKLLPMSMSAGAPLAMKLVEYGLNKAKESKDGAQKKTKKSFGEPQIAIKGPMPKAVALYY